MLSVGARFRRPDVYEGGFKPEMFVSSNQEHLDVVQAWKSSKKASVRNHSMAQDFYRI